MNWKKLISHRGSLGALAISSVAWSKILVNHTQDVVFRKFMSQNATLEVVNFNSENSSGVKQLLAQKERYLEYSLSLSSLVSNANSKTINMLFLFLVIVVVVFIIFIALMMIRQRQHREALEVVAYIDPVTNRGNFNKLKHDSKHHLFKNYVQLYALISMDVNKFKVLNDLYGYEKGNEVLRSIGDVIAKHLSQSEMFSRMVSDHFTILMVYETNEVMHRRLDTIIEEIHREVALPHLQMSVGIYVICDPTVDFSLMNDRANMAKKASKLNANHEYVSYRDEMRDTFLLESALEGDMKNALINQEFEAYLQPKYSLIDKKICGAEALVRWNHTLKGFLQPKDFIPLFEQNGFITQVDYYVLDAVCALIAKWIAMGREPYPISVNLSRLHMNNDLLAEELMVILNRHNIPTKYIELELTETTIDLNFKRVISSFLALKEKGFLIAIDDFGSGYSSLKLLKDIPADILKIDREFFHRLCSSEREKIVIESVIRMAEELDIRVVSEGVETKEQVEFLTSVGCGVVQGYYFARPMVIKEFERIAFES